MGLPLAPGTYRLDQGHSQIGFAVTHLGLTPVRGLFPTFEGVFTIGEQVADTSLKVSATMSSVQSGHPGRDDHLQAPDFFDSGSHPDMVFESTSVEAADGSWIIDGDLTVKGTTQPLRLTADMTGRAVYQLDGKEHIGFRAHGRLSRLAFGVGPAVPVEVLSDDIELEIAAQLIAD